MERELGGGESSARQPNHFCITKNVAHMCLSLFRGPQPMRRVGGCQEEDSDGAQLESSLEVGSPVEEKNEGLVQEGLAVAWAEAVLVCEEDGDRGSAGDGSL